MSALIALVDCNNFYASCERVFRPDLIGRPVAVLSNNDGCIVSRSQEVKALGIQMGVPVHQVKNLIEQHRIQLFSSNYTLYADMSQRVMSTLAEFTPDMEIYSIDEAFLDLSNLYPCQQNAEAYALRIKRTVQRYTGIPVCIGMGPTKTLAKLANFAAKKWPRTQGILDLTDSQRRHKLMAIVPVNEVWGIGRKISQRLNALGIHSVLDLARQDPEYIQQQFNIVVARTVMELNGIACLDLEAIAPNKQQIIASRSFGDKLLTFEELARAIADYASRASEKLRQQHSRCKHISIFIHTNPFSQTDPQYYRSAGSKLVVASNDVRLLSKTATQLLSEIFQPGYKYHKCGVVLSDIQTNSQPAQMDLFQQTNLASDNAHLMRTLDAINQRFPQSTVIAAKGFDRSWKAKAEHATPHYTTNWQQLVQAHCK